MAIFMQNIDGYKVLALLKVPGPLIEKMQTSGVAVMATATSLKFMQGAEVLSSIVVKATVLKELLDKGWDGKGAEYLSLSAVTKHAAEQVVKELTEGPAQVPVKAHGLGDILHDALFKGEKFTVKLTAVGPNKIGVIKVVRHLTGMGLGEAKNFVESNLPKTLMTGLPKVVAEKMKAELEAEGASVAVLSMVENTASATSTVSLLQKAADMGKEAASAPTPTFPSGHEVFPPNQMTSASTVKLRDALKMYQPVKGTDGDSRYFVVAMSSELKVAARYKQDKLSVRVEGQNLSNYVTLAKAAGFTTIHTEHPDNSYFSMHLQTGDLQMTARALGAVLCSLGLEFQTPLPKVSVIAGKGA